MNRYEVIVNEQITKDVSVYAKTEEEAMEMVRQGYDDDQVVNEDSIDSSVVSCNKMQKLETLKVNLIVKASDIDNEYIRPVCQRAKYIFSKLAPDNKWNELERKDVPVLKELGFSLEVAFLKETVIL
jgi:hypothetical protein